MAVARTRPEFSPHATLSVDDLSVQRGGRLVLDGVTFGLAAGMALQVTGPNGAGKSTLLRAVAGLLPVQAGRVTLAGGAPGEPPAERMHYLGHADGLKSALTAAENLRVAARLLGDPGLDPEAALDLVDLAHVADLPVAYLSAGQRRRVALARLVAARRPLWLLDEPATALDVAAQAGLARLAEAHLADGGLVVAAVHAPLGLATVGELRLAPDAPTGAEP